MSTPIKRTTRTTLKIGPFKDRLDGVSPRSSATLSGADQAYILKAGDTAEVDISTLAFSAYASALGWYKITLTSNITSTVGEGVIVVQQSSMHIPVHKEVFVYSSAIFDTFFGSTSAIAANVKGFTPTGTSSINVTLGNIRGSTATNDIQFYMVATSDGYTPVSGATLNVQRSINGGGLSAASGSVSEVGRGLYAYDADPNDLNGRSIILRASATNAVPSIIQIRPSQ